MSFTVADVILDVRELCQDTENTPYRYSDAFIVRKVNSILRRMVVLRPDLFTDIGTTPCVAGSLQSAPADSVRVMDVITNAAGTAVKEVSQDVLGMMAPTWGAGATGAATNWMRYPRDPNRFYVYPAQAGGELLAIAYAKIPSVATSSDVIPLRDAYMPAVIDGTSWLLESVDAEHADSGRAQMFLTSFKELMVAGLEARQISDTDAAAVPKAEVV